MVAPLPPGPGRAVAHYKPADAPATVAVQPWHSTKLNSPRTALAAPYPFLVQTKGSEPAVVRSALRPIHHLGLGSAAFEALLDAETGTVARGGNHVQVLPNGRVAFEARDDVSGMAEIGEVLHQQTFVSRDDATGWDNADLMMRHAQKGPARHMYDTVGSGDAIRNGGLIFKAMMAAGVEVEALGGRLWDVFRQNNRWHDKTFILGVRAGVLGGINIGDEYRNQGTPGSGLAGELGALRIIGRDKPVRLISYKGFFFKRPVIKLVQPWHDMDFLVQGPVVTDMQRSYIKTWKVRGRDIPLEQTAELTDPTRAPFFNEKAGGCSVRFIEHRPRESSEDKITRAWIRIIDAAQKSVVIESPYFSPPEDLLAALKRAADRGLDVTVLTCGERDIDFNVAYQAGAALHGELIDAGVKIFEASVMVHAKALVADTHYVCGGSPNMNGRSRFCDSESMVVIDNSTVARETQAAIEEQMARANEVTAAIVASRPLNARIRQIAGRIIAEHV